MVGKASVVPRLVALPHQPDCANNRFKQLREVISVQMSTVPLLGMATPKDAPDHHTIVRWREFVDALMDRRKQAIKVQDVEIALVCHWFRQSNHCA